MIRRRNGRYEVIVYLGRDAAGRKRQVSRSVRTEREAKAKEVELLAERDAGRRFDNPEATVDVLCDRWLEYARLQPSTRYQAERALARYVRPRLGTMRLSKLRPEDLDRLYLDLERGFTGQRALSPTSVRRIHTNVRAVLGLGVRWGWIATNPAARAQPPPERQVDPAPPSVEVVGALIAAAESPLDLFVWLAAETGIRRGGLCALRRSDLDLDSCSLRAVRALGIGSWAPYEKGTKTGHRHALALGPALCDLMRAHLKGQDETAAEYGTTFLAGAFVFAADVRGEIPWHPARVTRAFAELRATVPGAETTQLRSLRHWMVTEGLMSQSVRTVSGRAGHARPSTTLDRYAGFVPPSDYALAEVLDARIALAVTGE